MDVLDALRLVVDREAAAAVPDRCRRIELHRVVVLGREDVVGLMANRCPSQRRCGVAARLVRLVHLGGCAAFGFEIGRKRLLLVFDTHARCREFGSFPVLRDDERDWLTVELDPVVVKRAEG